MTTITRAVLRARFDRDAARGPDGSLPFIAATEGVKPDGLDLRMAGLEADDYLANPVVLWSHDYWGKTLPIGRTTKLVPLKTKLRAFILFDEEDPFAVEIRRKYEAGFLNAVSVGFEVIEWDSEDTRGHVVTRWRLLDISAVPVPGDPDALAERARSIIKAAVADHTADNPDDPEAPSTGQIVIPTGFLSEDLERSLRSMLEDGSPWGIDGGTAARLEPGQVPPSKPRGLDEILESIDDLRDAVIAGFDESPPPAPEGDPPTDTDGDDAGDDVAEALAAVAAALESAPVDDLTGDD